MWAVGIYDLRLTESAFWSLTLRKLALLIKRHSLEQERQDYRSAMICTLLYNINRGKGKKALSPTDFMPRAKTEKTAEQMFQTVKALNKLYGGTGGG